MTLAEKILASHAITDATTGRTGVPAVKPGDAVFVRADIRFTHEYVTSMAESFFKAELGPEAKVKDPASVYAFRDHLVFIDRVMPRHQIEMGLDRQALSLATEQEAFARRQGIKLYGDVQRDGEPAGSEAICHNKIVEAIALPGQVVAGTDSHTCMAGVLGCFAFGVGSHRHGQRLVHGRRAGDRAGDGPLRSHGGASSQASRRKTSCSTSCRSRSSEPARGSARCSSSPARASAAWGSTSAPR